MDKPELIQIKIGGVGSPMSGFVTGEYGVFRCGNCEWFDRDEEQCNNPRVNEDTSLTDRTKDGMVRVDSDDCCNHFWTKDLDPADYAKEQKLDTKSPHGFPATPAIRVFIKGKKK